MNDQKDLVTVPTQDLMMQTILNPAVFEQMQRGAKLFSESGLVPKQFEKNPAACFIGLQLAAQLGINPFMLFQRIYSPGGGKIGIETQVAVAVANQRGVFTGPIEHCFSGEGKTRACKATATLSRSGKEVSITVDWATVEAEGWAAKPGSKWRTMPDQMFRYRSSLWLIRTYCPEVLMGLQGTEEIEDSLVIDVTPVARKETISERLKEKADVPPPAEQAAAGSEHEAATTDARGKDQAPSNQRKKPLRFFRCPACKTVITASDRPKACHKCGSVDLDEHQTLEAARMAGNGGGSDSSQEERF